MLCRGRRGVGRPSRMKCPTPRIVVSIDPQRDLRIGISSWTIRYARSPIRVFHGQRDTCQSNGRFTRSDCSQM